MLQTILYFWKTFKYNRNSERSGCDIRNVAYEMHCFTIFVTTMYVTTMYVNCIGIVFDFPWDIFMSLSTFRATDAFEMCP